MNIYTVCLVAGFMLITAGCWCLVRTYHMLKIILGVEISMKAVTTFFIMAGHANGNMALTQAITVTVVVIEVIVAVVGTGTAVGLFRKYGSMDVRNLRKLKG